MQGAFDAFVQLGAGTGGAAAGGALHFEAFGSYAKILLDGYDLWVRNYADVDVVYIEGDGNVGIGTTSPASSL